MDVRKRTRRSRKRSLRSRTFEKENLKDTEHLENGKKFLMFGENLYLVPEVMPDLKGLKVLRPGLHLGSAKKDRLSRPMHWLWH